MLRRRWIFTWTTPFCSSWASENPVRKITREKEPRERTRFLNSEERGRFLEACRISDNPYLFTFVVLLLSTGGRYNEIRCLRWTDVDLHQGKITITKSKNTDMRSLPIRTSACHLCPGFLGSLI